MDNGNLLANETTTSLDNVKPGSTVFIKALNKAGLEGWDWAKVTLK